MVNRGPVVITFFCCNFCWIGEQTDCRRTNGQMDKKTNRQSDRQTNSWIEGQTDRQTDDIIVNCNFFYIMTSLQSIYVAK